MSNLLFVLLLVSGGAAAQTVYKCNTPSGVIYSDKPCAEDAAAISARPAMGASRSDAKQARLQNLVSLRKVAIGMDATMVKRAWGDPDKINRTITAHGVQQQWVYRRGEFRAQYVYLEDGVVTSISTD